MRHALVGDKQTINSHASKVVYLFFFLPPEGFEGVEGGGVCLPGGCEVPPSVGGEVGPMAEGLNITERRIIIKIKFSPNRKAFHLIEYSV